MIEVVILTSSDYGLAAHHLPYLLKSEQIHVKAVVVSEGVLLNKKKFYRNKLKKAWQIGILGTFNGFRIRKWFTTHVDEQLQVTSLYAQCLDYDIPYHTISSVQSEEAMWIFKQINADLGLSLGNGYIPKRIFSIPKLGMINIHHEVLPDYQNAQSVIWQLYNYSKSTGYTIHKIDSKIDTGEIVYQEDIPIQFENTLGKTVTQTIIALQKASAQGLVKVLENFGFYHSIATPQGIGNHYTTPSFFKFVKIWSNYKRLKKTLH